MAEGTKNKENDIRQELKFGKYLLIFGTRRLPPTFQRLKIKDK
jgi:hypothetical protein